MLDSLTCDGKETALFDSIDECLNIFQKSDHVPKNAVTSLYLLILTDGGNNFGKKECLQAYAVGRRSGQLQISGHMVQIGDSNCKRTKAICDATKYKFNYFPGGNVREFARSFTSSFKTEARNRVSKLRNRLARNVGISSSTNSCTDFTTLLPEVPTTPINRVPKDKILA